MTQHQQSTSPDAAEPGDDASGELTRPRAIPSPAGRAHLRGRSAPWGDGLRMIAVTTERLALANCSAGTSAYLPTVPADSEEPALD
jgi:hypothetical protein